MLSAREVGVVAQRELLRNLRSTKGIAMAAIFVLCGVLPSLVEVYTDREGASLGVDDLPDAAKKEFALKLLEATYGSMETAKHLAQAPFVLHTLFAGTVLFLPFFILPIGFDQLAGEIQHRTLRYSAGRASRASIVVGKALGIWGVISVMVLVLHLSVWVIAGVKGGLSAGALISWGGRFWFFSVICAAAYVGYASLVSSLFRTPIVALFVGAGGGLVIALLNKVFGFFEKTQAITWIFPNRYEKLIVSPDPRNMLGAMALLIGWGALCVAVSSLVVSRRDI
jgi:ABC-type transport system involved in multi-copper enzyme maturation permease subunit